MKKKIYYAVFFLFCFVTGYFLTSLLNKENKLKTKQFMGSTLIYFNKTVHNFDSIKVNKKAQVYFVYKNIGKLPLKINNIYSSCGCTVSIWSKEILEPERSDSILVTYDAEKLGKFQKTITVTYNGKDSPKVLKIKGTVLK